MQEPMDQAIKVVRGNPTPEELAAVIAILEAAHAEQVTSAKRQVSKTASSWNRNAANLRGTILPGFGQWSAQFRPGLD
ncbi:MAG: acyl-CoA carboxylase subunit epsilon [Micrococcales bacterium]|nr:acyl-CoA carboxylase subunit epsilon [Micrococcales bacterium]NBR54673.1 acyl-CoA carboxylase subunit epsilon [Micrococcales bacterium]NBR60764.1 acyl-CoA carboxylase subunit epsilon [Actinomycetota bacterium]NBT46704.1 acyl-CoA carboxylase subunit epsilon [Actinomycetota bacterium]NBY43571.1 acyl-CoA carboxylase subunit epsilon [Micrococcales bacterium]